VLLFSALAAGVATPDAECARWRTAFADMPERQVTLESGGRRLALRVKVADTPERRAAGFQCATTKEMRRTLILFDFGQEIRAPFHMQNVPASLDIAFATSDGRIFAILRMEPSPTALYESKEAFRYALEARVGFFSREGLEAGAARLVTKECRRPELKLKSVNPAESVSVDRGAVHLSPSA
jgi:uncharacterized membrane protein (UPF0127 family)